MHLLPLKLLNPLNLRPLRHIQLPHRTDEEIRLDLVLWVVFCFFTARRGLDLDSPLLLALIPHCFLDLGVESEMLEELVLLCDALEVR